MTDFLSSDLPFGELIDRVRRHYDDGCFACGRDNRAGLAIDDFALEEDQVAAWFRPQPHHRGTFGVLHGGLAATALDEIMAWAGIVLAGVLCVTATFEVRYRHPVPVGQPLLVRGRLVDRSGRRLRMESELVEGGRAAAQASGLYVVAHRVADLLAGTAP